MANKVWDTIRTIHASVENIPPAIVDLIAVFDILTLCVKGYSTVYIADDLDMDYKYIESVLEEYFNFVGWEKNIPINFYNIFKSTRQDFEKYSSTLLKMGKNYLSLEEIVKSYKVCFTYHRLREELGRYGY